MDSIAAFASVALLALVVIILCIQKPPAFCTYFVPVKGHPHVYTCSSHPKPRDKR